MKKVKQPLTIQQMQDELDKITYRKGWKFSVRQGAFEGAILEVVAWLDDSVNVGKKMKFHPPIPIPPCRSIEDFHLWLIYRLIRIESHEAREFFKVDGVPVFYPHMEGADQDILQEYFKGFENE